MPEWPQASPHKSAISIRPGVWERAQCSVCRPWWPSAPLSTFSLRAALMPRCLRAGSWEHRGARGVRVACFPWGT